MRVQIKTTEIDAKIARLKELTVRSRRVQEFYRDAVEEWRDVALNTTRDALNRPNWLLSRALAARVRDYTKRSKLFSIIGVEIEGDRRDPRNPAYYGVFQARKIGFYKKGERTSKPILKKLIDEASEKAAQLIQDELSR